MNDYANLEKPIYLREETWNFCFENVCEHKIDLDKRLKKLGYKISPDFNLLQAMVLISKRPGPFLLHSGILNKPELLKFTVIELEDECEYIITEAASFDIASNEKNTELVSLYDHTKRIVNVDEIKYSLRHGRVFDQLER